MVGRTQGCKAFFAWLAMVLFATPVRAVDFVFQYDDPAGFGFFDPTILPMDTVSVGERRRAALEFAGNIWGQLIRPSYFGEEIVVRAKFDPLASGRLAEAKPNFYYSDFGSSSSQYQSETNYPKALANHLAGRDLAPQRHEIDITINETVTNFYYRLDGMAGALRDFVTVAAHELGHGLGFTSSFQDDGDYGVLGDGVHYDPDPACEGCLPTPYDRLLTLGQMGQTLLSLSDDDAREIALISGNVYWNGTNGITGNGGTAPQMNAPSQFVAGTSTSHLDPSLDNPMRRVIMAPAYLGVRQVVSPVERGILRDLGWNTSVGPSVVTWIGLGADNKAGTAANWSPAVPLPGDSLAFGPSSRTGVNMDLTLYSIASINFAADAPAHNVSFARQNSTDITVGITNLSSQTQTIVVENGFANSPDRSGATLTFKTGTSAADVTFEVLGGGTDIEHPPNLPPRYVHGAGGRVVFEGNARAGSATFTVEGGRGAEGPQGMVIFRGGANGAPGASAGSARFHNKGGRVGVRLPAGFASGYGGETRFEGNSNAGTTARFRNDGEAESIDGTGGITTFTDDASAGDATFENFGVPQSAGFSALGGFTRFLSRSSAGTADFINFESAISNTRHGMGETQFWDDARAGTATFTNMGGTLEGRVGGVTRFYGRSTAQNGTFTNLGGGFRAGATEFYEDANAGSGTFLFPFNPPSAPNPVGSGRTDFFDRSVASAEVLPRAEYTFEGGAAANSVGGGGTVMFHDNTRAGLARFTFRTFSKGNVYFTGNASADRAEFLMEDQAYGKIWFQRDSSASDRTYNITAGSNITFFHSSTAANSTITIQNGASGAFGQPELLTDSAAAGDATIRVMGATLNTPPGVPVGGRLRFNEGSSAGSARITVEGGIGAGAAGARLTFAGGTFWPTTLANSTLTVNGGTDGALGGNVLFFGGVRGGTARLIANASGTFDFGDQRFFNGTEVGSIEGDGSFVLNGSLLTTGNRNEDATVAGQITNGNTPGAMLTKVGTRTLTLAGNNTFNGLTTVNAGTLRVTGSIAGGAVVNSGGRLNGTGTIGGVVTVNAGGVFSPGTSPGTITVGGLTMMPGSTLEFEVGQTARDRIVLSGSGNTSLAGTLNLLPLDDAPTLGQSFPLFEGAVGSITGSFDTIIAPTFNGLTLNIAQNGNSVMLQVATDASEKIWGVDAGGAVSAGANWQGGLPPLGANDAAAFTGAISADRTVQIDAPVNWRSVRFDDDNGFMLQGETLTLQAPGIATGVIQVRNTRGNGAHTIAAPIIVASNLDIIDQSVGAFTLSAALDNSAGRTITKIGTGTLVIAGAQIHGASAALTVSAGTVNINTDAGSDTSRNLTVNANSTTNFGSTQHLAYLNVGPDATATITSGGPKVLVANALTIAGSSTPTGKLDLTDNDLIVHATAATKDAVHDAIQDDIARAQNGLDANLVTKWDGPGITSSFARTANVMTGFDLTGLGAIRNSDLDIITGLPGSSYTTFSGQPVTPDDILVKYTYIGDANLSGAVSFDDYVGMDNAFFTLIPNLGWATGDINFDGVINFDDYSKIDQAFFFQGPPLSVQIGTAVVPEPGTWLLALICWLPALLAYGKRMRPPGGAGVEQ